MLSLIDCSIRAIINNRFSTILLKEVIEMIYRITRPELYIDFNCPGHNDTSCRQGHCYYVDSLSDAIVAASKSFDDKYFDVQQWDNEKDEGGKVTTWCRPVRLM